MKNHISVLEAKLSDAFKEKLTPTPFLSRRIVSFQGNKNRRAYSWYKYKEAFSAELVSYVLVGYKGGVHGKVLDPFAGIGTTLFAASEHGISADGIELLPLGQEIINARFLLKKREIACCASILNQWIISQPWKDFQKRIPFQTLRITKNAYPSDTVAAIERYKGALLQENEQIQPVLQLALLCVLESISYTRKDGQCLRWDVRAGKSKTGTKPFKKGEIFTFDVAITEKLKEIVSDICSADTTPPLFSTQNPAGDMRLFSGSSLDILPTLEAAAYGAVLTSPPYCNRYDYTRTYALELAMLGLTHENVSKLRQQMLSCTVENREKALLTKFPHWEPFIEAASQQPLLTAILTYLEDEKASGKLNNNGIPRMVRGYFFEMACIIGECFRVMTPKARFFMVNDNVRYAGVSISVDLILSDIAQSIGFEVEEILILPSRKGNSSQQMGTYGREALRKCVYVWRKP